MDDKLSEPTLLSSTLRYPWLVLVITLVATALAYGYTVLKPPVVKYAAEASLVVQATSSGLDLGTSGSPSRFIANQVEILQSAAVAERAAELAAAENPSFSLGAEDVSRGSDVFQTSDSDLIRVVFTAEDPQLAVTGANALVNAYQELLTQEKASVAAASIARIDAELEDLDARSAALNQQIEDRLASDPVRSTLDLQYSDAIAQIVDLQSEAATASADELAVIRDRLNDLRTQISTYTQILAVGRGDFELTELQSEQDQVLARKATLLDRRDAISVEVEGSEDIVAFESLAKTAKESGGSEAGRILAVSMVVGLLGGLGIAYLVATRKDAFRDRAEPASILQAPLLAEIPDFTDEGLKTPLPVRDSPRSASAEAFRFASTSIELRLHNQGAKTLVVLSATLGAGKSTVLANTALAAAREGNRVLLIDADFGNQMLTALLAGDEEWLPQGLTDVVAGHIAFEDAVSRFDIGPDVQLFLLSRGRQPVAASDLVKSPRTQRLLEAARDQYDFVFVDAPPLLQVAYASTLADYGDVVMMIVDHGGSAGQLREARTRLDLIGSPLLGYVYNRSPLRREMLSSEGSMADVLGDRGMLEEDATPSKPDPRWRR